MYSDDFTQERINRTAFFTGHRNLNEADRPVIQENLFRCISDAYASGYRRFFCGCALGFDTLAAFQTVRLKKLFPDVWLSLAIPCESQAERWKVSDRQVYQRLLELADEKIVLSPFYYRGVMLSRNRYMADRSSLCICWLTDMHGGTAYAVRYALRSDRIKIVNLAVPDVPPDRMREKPWNYMFISPSADKNAVTVHLSLSRGRKLVFRRI